MADNRHHNNTLADNNDGQQPRDDEEQEIDLLELAGKLWSDRRTLIKWAVIGAVAGIIIAFSIPREYTATIKLAPEAGEKTMSGNFGALAAMAGINSGSSGGKDAVSPQLYPDIVSSLPFTVEMFDVKVTNLKGDETKTVSEYLTHDISAPWWSYITSLPGRIIGGILSIFRGGDHDATERKVDLFHLTPQENAIAGALAGRVDVDVDGKTSIISINVTMQDPMVAAMLADTVAGRLKDYVTDYRTNKARADMEYAQRLCDEARDDYYRAQQRYAAYSDKNKGIVLQSARTEEERLQNEMSLAFNLYNSTAQQLQVAKAKVQEITPVYTVLQPSTVPLAPSKPSKALILVGCVFLAVVAAAAWILFGRDLTKVLRGAVKNSDDKDSEPKE